MGVRGHAGQMTLKFSPISGAGMLSSRTGGGGRFGGDAARIGVSITCTGMGVVTGGMLALGKVDCWRERGIGVWVSASWPHCVPASTPARLGGGGGDRLGT